MKKILLTGYTPYDSASFEATSECAEKYHRKKYGDITVIGEILPNSSLPAFKKIESVMRKHKFDAIVNMGTMNSSKGLSLEANFKNCLGFKNEVPVWNVNNAKPILTSHANLKKLNGILEENDIPSFISLNSSISIHNALGYLVTKMIESNNKYNHVRNLFIHVPLVWDYKSEYLYNRNEFYMQREKYHKAIELILKNICNE